MFEAEIPMCRDIRVASRRAPPPSQSFYKAFILGSTLASKAPTWAQLAANMTQLGPPVESIWVVKLPPKGSKLRHVGTLDLGLAYMHLGRLGTIAQHGHLVPSWCPLLISKMVVLQLKLHHWTGIHSNRSAIGLAITPRHCLPGRIS